MIGSNDYFKIIDFGDAKIVDNYENTSSNFGKNK